MAVICVCEFVLKFAMVIAGLSAEHTEMYVLYWNCFQKSVQLLQKRIILNLNRNRRNRNKADRMHLDDLNTSKLAELLRISYEKWQQYIIAPTEQTAYRKKLKPVWFFFFCYYSVIIFSFPIKLQKDWGSMFRLSMVLEPGISTFNTWILNPLSHYHNISQLPIGKYCDLCVTGHGWKTASGWRCPPW